MLRVLCGRPGDGRGDLLAAEAAASPGRGLLHVVRTRPRAEALLSAASNRGAVVGAPIVAFDDFVASLSARRRSSRRALGGAARRLLIAALADEFAVPPLRGAPGLVAWLGRLFSALKRTGVYSRAGALAAFPRFAERGPGVAAALALLDAYGARLVRDGLYDDDGVAFEVGRDLGTDELPLASVSPRRVRLSIEGFFRTAPVERSVFERLFAAFPETVWLVDAPDAEVDAPPGAGVYADLPAGSGAVEGDRSWLRRIGAIFASAPTEVPVASASAALSSPADADDEAREIAACVAAARAEDPRTSILIVAPSDRDAEPALARAFADVGVPLAVGAVRRLGDTEPARAAARMLGLAAGDFARDDVVAALRGAPRGFGFGPPEGRRALTAATAARVARRAAIFGGAESWTSRARALAVASRAEGGPGSASAADEAESVADGVVALAARLGVAGGATTARAFAVDASSLCADCGLFDAATRLPAEPDAVLLRAAAEDGAARRGLADALLAYAEDAAAAGEPPRPYREHVPRFVASLAERPLRPPPAPAGAPRLVGLRDVRGLRADRVFVVGLSDRTLPEGAEAPPVLDAEESARAGGRTYEAARREAVHLLVAARAAARVAVVFSLPRRDARGETSPPREFLVACPDLAEAAPKAARAPRVARSDLGRAFGRAIRASDVATALGAWPALVARGADPRTLPRAVIEEAARGADGPLRRAEGMLETEAWPLLAAAEGPDAPWSASRFDEYVACPLRSFFVRALGARVEEDLDREPSARDRGDVLHRALRRLFEESPSDETAEAAEARLRAAALEECARLGRDDLYGAAFAAEVVRGLVEPGAPRGPLKAALDFERARDSAFRPRFFEASFGRPPRGASPRAALSDEPVRLAAPDGRTFRFEGSVDRVDVAIDARGVRAFVVDYKSGKGVEDAKGCARGRLLQLPLYAAALAGPLAAALGVATARVVGATYFALRGAEPGFVRGLLDRATAEDVARTLVRPRRKFQAEGAFAALVDRALVRAADARESFYAGRHHATLSRGADAPCERCEFSAGCRGRGEAARLAERADDRLFPPEFPEEDAPSPVDRGDDDGGGA